MHIRLFVDHTALLVNDRRVEVTNKTLEFVAAVKTELGNAVKAIGTKLAELNAAAEEPIESEA